MTVRVGDVVAAIESRFPAHWAEPWDNVGLLAGDGSTPVTGVLVSLDPSVTAIDRAIAAGCNVLATHHPVTLRGLEQVVAAGEAPELHHALASGVALVAAHTNLDRAPGAGAALAALVGLRATGPLERALLHADLVTVFAPSADAASLREAMAAAGAGRIGAYTECSFSAIGEGRFTPDPHAHPVLGEIGQESRASETRIEMIAARGTGGRVADAAEKAHPYEHPLIAVTEVSISRGPARMGCVCELEDPLTLEELAKRVSELVGSRPRVWGDPGSELRSVACATGSAGSLLPDVRSRGAHALIAGEVRYHDALAAAASGLWIIEIGHDVSEWPLVPLLAEAVGSTQGLPDELVHVDRPRQCWWTP